MMKINLPALISKPKQATLPEEMVAAIPSIENMEVGEEGWVHPWAMFADDELKLWLTGGFILSNNNKGTSTISVIRKTDGWHVDASGCRGHYWKPENGVEEASNAIPVMSVNW